MLHFCILLQTICTMSSTASAVYDNKRFIERGSHKGKGLAVFTSGGDSQGMVVLFFFYSVVCLTTGPKPLQKRFLHIVRSKASSFKWEYPLLSLRSSSSFLRLLPRLLVTGCPLLKIVIYNTYCFSTATMVRQMRLNVTLQYVTCFVFVRIVQNIYT